MSRFLCTAFAVAFLFGFGGGIASAKQCRDEHGKFSKCPPAKTHKRCRDAKGKFTKCPAK